MSMVILNMDIFDRISERFAFYLYKGRKRFPVLYHLHLKFPRLHNRHLLQNRTAFHIRQRYFNNRYYHSNIQLFLDISQRWADTAVKDSIKKNFDIDSLQFIFKRQDVDRTVEYRVFHQPGLPEAYPILINRLFNGIFNKSFTHLLKENKSIGLMGTGAEIFSKNEHLIFDPGKYRLKTLRGEKSFGYDYDHEIEKVKEIEADNPFLSKHFNTEAFTNFNSSLFLLMPGESLLKKQTFSSILSGNDLPMVPPWAACITRFFPKSPLRFFGSYHTNITHTKSNAAGIPLTYSHTHYSDQERISETKENVTTWQTTLLQPKPSKDRSISADILFYRIFNRFTTHSVITRDQFNDSLGTKKKKDHAGIFSIKWIKKDHADIFRNALTEKDHVIVFPGAVTAILPGKDQALFKPGKYSLTKLMGVKPNGPVIRDYDKEYFSPPFFKNAPLRFFKSIHTIDKKVSRSVLYESGAATGIQADQKDLSACQTIDSKKNGQPVLKELRHIYFDDRRFGKGQEKVFAGDIVQRHTRSDMVGGLPGYIFTQSIVRGEEKGKPGYYDKQSFFKKVKEIQRKGTFAVEKIGLARAVDYNSPLLFHTNPMNFNRKNMVSKQPNEESDKKVSRSVLYESGAATGIQADQKDLSACQTIDNKKIGQPVLKELRHIYFDDPRFGKGQEKVFAGDIVQRHTRSDMVGGLPGYIFTQSIVRGEEKGKPGYYDKQSFFKVEDIVLTNQIKNNFTRLNKDKGLSRQIIEKHGWSNRTEVRYFLLNMQKYHRFEGIKREKIKETQRKDTFAAEKIGLARAVDYNSPILFHANPMNFDRKKIVSKQPNEESESFSNREKISDNRFMKQSSFTGNIPLRREIPVTQKQDNIIDINDLTDQVVRVLERKIIFEKERRGW